MRLALPLLLLAAAFLASGDGPEATARPEFARREGKACGYCHINPRGGGARNGRGLEYARNEFSFPTRKGNLRSFERARDREAMVRARKLIDLNHTKAAVEQLRRLGRSVKRDPVQRKLVADELHELDVRGTEILGQARLMVRGQEVDEGIELLVMLVHEYESLDVHAEAKSDLKELRREKEHRERIRKEQREAKARLLLLDARLLELDGRKEKARRNLERIAEKYAGTRAAEDVKKELEARRPKPEAGGQAPESGEG